MIEAIAVLIVAHRLWVLAASIAFTLLSFFLYHYKYARPMVEKRAVDTNERINDGIALINVERERTSSLESNHEVLTVKIDAIQATLLSMKDQSELLRVELRKEREAQIARMDRHIELILLKDKKTWSQT